MDKMFVVVVHIAEVCNKIFRQVNVRVQRTSP